MKKVKKNQKPSSKKPIKQPKDLRLKAPVNKPDLVKVIGAGVKDW